MLAELAQTVAEPPLRLHDRAVAVRLEAQVGQRGLQHLRRLGPPSQPQQEAAELVPGPGAECRALAGLVGPVGRLKGVLGRLLRQSPAADDLGELEAQLGPPDRLQLRPAVLQGRPQRPFRLGDVPEMVREPRQPGLVLHREPRHPRADVRRRGAPEQLRGPLHVPGVRRQLREHRLRLGGPRRESHVVPGTPLDQRQHLPRGGSGIREHRSHRDGAPRDAAPRVAGPPRAVGGVFAAFGAGVPQGLHDLLHPPHQDPRPSHQHRRRLPYARAVLGVQREDLVVGLGDRRQGLVHLAREGAYIGRTRACRQGLSRVARLRVQLGGTFEESGPFGAAVHRLVVGDLRAVEGVQLDALRGPGDGRPRLDGVRLQGVRHPPRLGDQGGQVRLVAGRRGDSGRRCRGRRDGGPRRPHAQRQPFHQRTLRHTRACPLADVPRAVALVEAGGQREGLAPSVRGEVARAPRPVGRSRHPLLAEPELGQTVHEQGHHGHEVQLAARMPVVREVRRPLCEQLQAAGLVAGQRAELDVVRVGPAHALHGPYEPETPQMVGARLVRAAEPQQGRQGGREHRVRLVRAGVLALQDRRPQLQRRRVPPALRLPPALPVQLAGVTVGHGVPVGGQPGGVRPLGPLHVPGVRGHTELGTAHGPLGVPGQPVAVFHLAEPLLDGGQRYVRLVQHAGRHPLEDPVQRVRLVGVEVLGPLVPHAQQPREGHEHLGLFGAVVVDLQLVPERLDHRERHVQLLRLGEQLLRARVARRALRLLGVLRHRPAQLVEVRDPAHQ